MEFMLFVRWEFHVILLLMFRYKIKKQNGYGSLNADGSWTGMVGLVNRQVTFYGIISNGIFPTLYLNKIASPLPLFI